MSLTYPEATGSTLAGGELPPGYAHLDRRVRLGSGPECFERAGSAVLAWGAQRGAGLRVTPGDDVRDGADVELRLLWLRIPCRVVAVVRDSTRIGFAYGTLPGHPERGEEAFLVTRDADDSVWFRIRAFSRPGRWYTRLAGPAGRVVQLWATRRYLRAVARTVGGGRGPGDQL
ncbi:DUF1990 domain-containing protein [Streptomyces kunmingensis]|uniref:DUF1990 domain-containing protein n=1 Tax=Streptomyces kunmingensis TaxID=68225 RepID=A0ABU6C483_9ACTN|nr:DUF1990 domain-containing protein [Streptomyces kunmingensis]MEB3959531.1 DUF1990 domain-containing protein [Streptomyces kunmingensis]